MTSNIVYNIKENKQYNEQYNEQYNKQYNKQYNENQYNEIINIVESKYNSNMEDTEFDTIVSLQLYYEDNYNKKDLDMIADYYSISKRKKRKTELIQDIVLFELNPYNNELTQKRKLMWFYLSELETDSYLRKFLIFK